MLNILTQIYEITIKDDPIFMGSRTHEKRKIKYAYILSLILRYVFKNYCLQEGTELNTFTKFKSLIQVTLAFGR